MSPFPISLLVLILLLLILFSLVLLLEQVVTHVYKVYGEVKMMATKLSFTKIKSLTKILGDSIFNGP